MPSIFISYRRKSWPFTQRLADELAARLDADIFVDFSGIDETDFEHAILRHLTESDAVLLIVTEHTFSDRIHRDDDWVRREIREALSLNKPLILVCVEGLLPPSGLPDDIKDVARMQGINFYPEYFTPAIERLAQFVTKVGATPRRSTPPASVTAPTTDEKNIGGRATLDEALGLLQAGDFSKAIFLLESLAQTNYQSRYVNIAALLEQARHDAERAERQRQASLDYEEIVLLARRKVTAEHAQEAFAQWCEDYPDFIEELDTENLWEKFNPATATTAQFAYEIAAKADAPVLMQFADQIQRLETALSEKNWRHADNITIEIFRKSSGHEMFDSDESARAIPEALIRKLDAMWKQAGKPLRGEGWFQNANLLMNITTFVSLLSFKTYLERRFDELGL